MVLTLCTEEYVYMVVLERIHLESQNFGLANYATKEKHEEVKSRYTMPPTLVVGSSRSTTVQPTTNEHVSIVCNFLQKSLCSFFARFLLLLLQAASMPTGISQKRFV
jgi:hypothetical protein